MKEQFLNLSGLIDLVTYMKLCIAQHKVIIPRASFSLFPKTGDENNIYIDTSTNAIYRWNDTDKKFVLLAKPPRTIAISEGTNNGEITLKVDNIASNAKVHGLTSTAFTESNKFATAAQGAKADSAVQTITLSSGTKNGTIKIKVNNITTDNIEVAGLGSAAFSDIGIFAAKSHTHKKDEVGLGNVDNTADINKSVKYATSAGAVSWKNITDKPTLFPPTDHNHDSLYYRKNEVDSLLSGKSDTGHTHVQFIQEVKFSNGTYSDPLNGTAVAIKASGGIASDLIYEGGKTLADKYQAKGSYAAASHKQAYTSGECTTYNADDNTMGVTPAAVKKAFGIFGPKAHTHKKSDITDFPTSLPASDVYGWAKASSKPSYTKSEVGLGNVDNTADANKSVKYAGSSGSSNTVVYTALTNTDLNTLQTEGRWYYAGGGNTCTNIPVAPAAFELYVGRNASGWRYQQFTVTSGEIYIRVFDSSNWGSWRKLAFTSDTVTAASSVPWSGITGKPSTFAPSSHNHTIANITDIGKASVNFANSAGCPQGFALRQATATWGNQTGTVVTDWHTSNGGDIAFRDNKGQLNVVIDGFFYQNEGKNLVLDSGNYSNYAAAKSHTHTISNITNLQTTLDGKSNTNHTHDLNPMINTLTIGTSDPIDADYYIAQYAGGGSTTTTYHRRPHSALWNYIKSKANSVYQPKGSYAASSHTHDDRYYTESEINTKLASKSDTSHTHNYVVGSYTGNGGQQKPNYFGTNKVGFLMMNTTVNGDSNYKDWIIMDCYGGNDVGGSVALGVNRQKLGAYIMRSTAARTAWVESAELLHTQNYTSYTVTKTGSGASGTWGISISGNASSASSVPWSGVTGKPSSYTPSSHTHSSVTDIGNGSTTTFAYSKSGLGYGDFTWLAAWNGYELRAVNKSLFAQASHTHTVSQISDFGPHVYDATISRTANTVLAAPNGKAGSASFRALVAADIPSITKSKITDFPTSLPASDVYAWAKASSKPSYSWGEITGKPSTFAPSSHTHNYAGSSSAGGSANWANGATYSNYAIKLQRNPTENKSGDGLFFFQASSDTTKMPNGNWWSLIRTQHPGYANGYWQEIALAFDSDNLAFRRNVNGTKTAWKYVSWSDHTHNYAGSSSAGGAATSANKLNTNAGSTTQPVYFSNGVPVACTYTLGKSVPSNAVFTDTNTWRPLGTTADTACAGNDGRLSNARTPVAGSNDYVRVYNSNNVNCSSTLTFNDLAKQHYAMGMIYGTEDNPLGEKKWTHGISMAWSNGSNANWVSQIALGVNAGNGMWYRTTSGSITGLAWKRLLDSSNYTSYTVTKTGGGASGTWGINVTGSAGSVAWGNVSGKPSSYTPSSHTHDDRYYTEAEINTKLGAKLGAVSANGYYGLARPDGNTSDWIRTTTAGIIPYQSGGAGGGHCGLGTSSWYFSNAYIDTVNCVNASVSGHIDVGGYIQSSNLINTYFEYQSNRGTIDWRFGSATGTGDENFFGFYDAKTGKIPLALDGNFGNIYVGFNVGGLNQKTAVGVYLGAQVSGNRAFIYHGDSYAGSIWIQTRLDGSWKWFSLGRACSTALSDIRLKGDIRDTEVEDATKVIESMKIRSFERKDSHKKYKIGFIADELEQLDPNLVDGGGEVDGHPYYKSVNNLQMLAYVVKGMQELNSKVTILEQENKRLKQKLNMCN